MYQYDESLNVIENKYCIQILVIVYQNPDCSQLFVLNNIRGNNKTVYARFKMLKDAGLLEIDKGHHENNANLLYLTKKGNILAAKFSEMFNFRKISE